MSYDPGHGAPGSPPPGGPQPGGPQPGGPPPGAATGPQGPGWYQAADGYWYAGAVEAKKSKTGLIIGIIVAVVVLVCLLPTVAIVAITFLGRSASQKFSSVGSAVGLVAPLDWGSLRALLGR